MLTNEVGATRAIGSAFARRPQLAVAWLQFLGLTSSAVSQVRAEVSRDGRRADLRFENTVGEAVFKSVFVEAKLDAPVDELQLSDALAASDCVISLVPASIRPPRVPGVTEATWEDVLAILRSDPGADAVSNFIADEIGKLLSSPVIAPSQVGATGANAIASGLEQRCVRGRQRAGRIGARVAANGGWAARPNRDPGQRPRPGAAADRDGYGLQHDERERSRHLGGAEGHRPPNTAPAARRSHRKAGRYVKQGRSVEDCQVPRRPSSLDLRVRPQALGRRRVGRLRLPPTARWWLGQRSR